MPLYKRRCQECDLLEDDRYEQVSAEMTIECPVCKSVSFTKVHSVPKLPPDGLYSFGQELDVQRERAASGHGNASYRV